MCRKLFLLTSFVVVLSLVGANVALGDVIATDPTPADGAEDVALNAKLSWTAGDDVVMHDVYFGTDEAAVAALDPSTFQGKLLDASFDPGPLEPFMTYYWKVDEWAVIVTHTGPVWSFSTPKYIVIDDDETTLDYDNGAEPYLSEASWDTPQDLTVEGLADLTLRFHGAPAHVDEGSVSYDGATGTYSITGSGADVWASADEFHYGYRELTGDGEIVARVVDNGTGSNNWAKGGVMIRESLAAGSKHNIVALTGSEGGGITFQGRPVTGERSNSMHGDITASPPHWVKLTRVGNTFTAYHSADGVTWELFTDTVTDGDITNPIDVEMADPVLIGLFVTSHQSGELRTYTFDNVDIVGDISADTASTDVGFSGNSAEPIYVALEDSTGAVAMVTHPYAEATMIDAWRDWTIPLSKFTGVDPSDATKLYVGVGDGEPGGSGSIRVDDIRVVMPTAANIVWVTVTSDDAADGAQDDQAWIDWLEAEGHNVDARLDYWTELDASKVDELNAADLVIVSRSTHSGDFTNDDETTLWNSVTSPLILMNVYIVRSSRWMWMDTTSQEDADDIIVASDPAHPLFDGVSFEEDNLVIFLDNSVGSGMNTFTGSNDVGNGTLIAQRLSADQACIAEWEAGVEFYAGSGQTAGGPRMLFAAGTMETADPPTPQGAWNLTADGEIMFRNAVNMMLPAVELDVTAPGDIVQGVPNDGLMDGDNFGWPGAETPPLAIDDNTGTKFLHFKGELEPTGFQVTPLDGPTIVTGLTFTTANDAEPRDPVSFELSGSNDSIDGPYELIASGDIVDFAQEAAWPRFTKNETPISFDNDSVYAHYQVLFPAVRDAASANSMQIAEVELIGVPVPTPADVTAPGDAIQGVPNDGLMDGDNFGWPGAETPDLAIDDNKRKKFLHFKGELEPTGFQVTPSAGPTIVTGMTFTTANDAEPRDPAAFELYGSNESIDGPYELIAVGDIVDFAQADAWPRFRMNATPISFDNTVAYAHYQVLFPAVRDAGSANSMQIAEVELIGLPVVPFSYAYDGDALDDTWDHDNGSDAWDGTGPGEGMPGGAVSLTEDGVTFLRIQDTGDPRDYGMSDPTNRKVYLSRPIDIGLDGARLEFCARVATSAPLDDMHPDGGAGIEPWPAGGIGYHIRDDGKGMIGIGEPDMEPISFSLAKAGEPGFEDVATDVLVMNNLVGDTPSDFVDTEDAAAAVAVNMVAVDDVTQWHTFTIDIATGGAGTHILTVSVDGGPAESFEVTAGTGGDLAGNYIAIGSSGTGGITAFDVDYLSVQ